MSKLKFSKTSGRSNQTVFFANLTDGEDKGIEGKTVKNIVNN